MAEDALVNADIEDGRALVEQLERSHFPLKAAAWVHELEGEVWRLYLVTSVRNRDFLGAYTKASQALLSDEDRKDRLKRISFKIIDSKEPLGKTLIGWARSTDRDYRRVSGSSPLGQFVDAFVYRPAA